MCDQGNFNQITAWSWNRTLVTVVRGTCTTTVPSLPHSELMGWLLAHQRAGLNPSRSINDLVLARVKLWSVAWPLNGLIISLLDYFGYYKWYNLFQWEPEKATTVLAGHLPSSISQCAPLDWQNTTSLKVYWIYVHLSVGKYWKYHIRVGKKFKISQRSILWINSV